LVYNVQASAGKFKNMIRYVMAAILELGDNGRGTLRRREGGRIEKYDTKYDAVAILEYV
jgi:hypothetical protein